MQSSAFFELQRSRNHIVMSMLSWQQFSRIDEFLLVLFETSREANYRALFFDLKLY